MVPNVASGPSCSVSERMLDTDTNPTGPEGSPAVNAAVSDGNRINRQVPTLCSRINSTTRNPPTSHRCRFSWGLESIVVGVISRSAIKMDASNAMKSLAPQPRCLCKYTGVCTAGCHTVHKIMMRRVHFTSTPTHPSTHTHLYLVVCNNTSTRRLQRCKVHPWTPPPACKSFQ